MLKLSKLTDYAMVVMAHLARHPEKSSNARSIAEQTGIALPTTSKLLKRLAQYRLLVAQRGVKGGYRLILPASGISLLEIIQALEGQVALTECSHTERRCSVEKHCLIRDNWRKISAFFHGTLDRISVSDLIRPLELEPLLKQLVVIRKHREYSE